MTKIIKQSQLYNQIYNSVFVTKYGDDKAELNFLATTGTGWVNVAADFPTLISVVDNDAYMVPNGVTVTDNDPTKTNTGQTFVGPKQISWISSTSKWMERTGKTENDPVCSLSAGSYLADIYGSPYTVVCLDDADYSIQDNYLFLVDIYAPEANVTFKGVECVGDPSGTGINARLTFNKVTFDVNPISGNSGLQCMALTGVSFCNVRCKLAVNGIGSPLLPRMFIADQNGTMVLKCDQILGDSSSQDVLIASDGIIYCESQKIIGSCSAITSGAKIFVNSVDRSDVVSSGGIGKVLFSANLDDILTAPTNPKFDSSNPSSANYYSGMAILADGQTTLTLSTTPSNTKSLILFRNGVAQDEDINFTISGDTITWIDPNPLRLGIDVIEVAYDSASGLGEGDLTESTSSVLTITGGTNAVNGSGTTIQVKQSSGSQGGYLSSTDWSTFNGKEPALTKGNLSETTSSVLTITGGTGAVIGSGTTVEVKQASGSQAGYLSSTDWTTFNGKVGGLGTIYHQYNAITGGLRWYKVGYTTSSAVSNFGIKTQTIYLGEKTRSTATISTNASGTVVDVPYFIYGSGTVAPTIRIYSDTSGYLHAYVLLINSTYNFIDTDTLVGDDLGWTTDWTDCGSNAFYPSGISGYTLVWDSETDSGLVAPVTATFTGPFANQTVYLNFYRNSNVVSMLFRGLSATANGTTAAIQGTGVVPAALRTAITVEETKIDVLADGTSYSGNVSRVSIDSSGNVIFKPLDSETFTASGVIVSVPNFMVSWAI